MPTPEDPKTQAYQKAASSMQKQVKDQLRDKWRMLQAAASKLGKSFDGDPSEEKLDEMTQEAINQRQISFNGQTLTFDEIDKDEELRKALGGKSINKMVPTSQQIGLISTEVAEGVAENTGTGIGFLDGILGMFGMGGVSLGGLFTGLMNWIGGGFQTSLSEEVGKVMGDGMSNSVGKRLTALREQHAGKEDDLSGFLDDAAISRAAGTVRAQVIATATGIPATETPASTGFPELDASTRGMIVGQIKTTLQTEITAGFKGEGSPLAEVYKDGDTLTGDLAALGMTNKKEIKDALDAIAEKASARVAAVIGDPNYTYQGNDAALAALKGKKLSVMSPEDRANVLAAESRDEVRKLSDQAADPKMKMLERMIGERLSESVRTKILEPETYNKIPWGALGTGKGTATTSLAQEHHSNEAMYEYQLIKLAAAEQINAMANQPDYKDLLKQMAGGEFKKKHGAAVADAIAPAIQKFRKEHQGAVSADDLKAFSARLAASMTADAEIINNAADDSPLRMEKEEFAALADQIALSVAGKNAAAEEKAKFQGTVDTHKQAVARRIAGRRIVETIDGIKTDFPVLNQALIQIAGGEILNDQSKAIATATESTLADFELRHTDAEGKPIAVKSEEFSQLSGELFAKLKQQRETINGETVKGKAQFNDQTLAVLADQMTLSYLSGKPGGETVPKAFLDAVHGHKSAAVTPVIQAELRQKMADNLEGVQGFLGAVTTTMWNTNLNNFGHTGFRTVNKDEVASLAAPVIAGIITDESFDQLTPDQQKGRIATALKPVLGGDAQLSPQVANDWARRFADGVVEKYQKGKPPKVANAEAPIVEPSRTSLAANDPLHVNDGNSGQLSSPLPRGAGARPRIEMGGLA